MGINRIICHYDLDPIGKELLEFWLIVDQEYFF